MSVHTSAQRNELTPFIPFIRRHHLSPVYYRSAQRAPAKSLTSRCSGPRPRAALTVFSMLTGPWLGPLSLVVRRRDAGLMDETSRALFFAWLGFSSIAGLTFFFSSRPRLFIRAFVPRGEWRGAVRAFVRDPQFGRGMRFISALQFAVASAIGLVCLWRQIA